MFPDVVISLDKLLEARERMARMEREEVEDFRIDITVSRGEETEVITIFREYHGEELEDVVREVYEAFEC